MICPHCSSEWNVSSSLSVTLENCPFCGGSLKKRIETIEEALLVIGKKHGAAALCCGQELPELFAEIAPHLPRELRLLRHFVECGGPARIMAAIMAADGSSSAHADEIRREMQSELFIEENAARSICESFCRAASQLHPAEAGAAPAAAEPPAENRITLPTPAAAPKETAEELFCKGLDFYHGSGSTPRDYQKAFDLFSRAALKGCTPAIVKLGIMHRLGYGVPADSALGLKCLTRAAMLGDADGQFEAGFCYVNGIGTEIDRQQGKYWYVQAAEQGHGNAQTSLGTIYRTEGDYKKALFWYKKAADQNMRTAIFYLGEMYEKGLGIKQDTAMASKLYEQSAALNWAPAKTALERLKNTQPIAPEEKHPPKAMIENRLSLYLLLKQHNLEENYLTMLSPGFEKSVREYFGLKRGESLLLVQNSEITPPTPGIFALTGSMLYCRDARTGKKEAYPLERISSVAVSTLNASNQYCVNLILAPVKPGQDYASVKISRCRNFNHVGRMRNFWKDLLNL